MFRWLRILTVILAFSLLAACADRKATPTPYNPLGLSGKINPEAETNFAKARVLWKDGDICADPAQALVYLDRAIELQPDYAEAYLRRGLAKSDLKDWDGAFGDLSRAIRLHPSAEAYAFRGLVSMRGGNTIGARKDLDYSLELQRSQHRAWNYRGGLNLIEGREQDACSDFSRGCSNGDCTGRDSARRQGICK